MNILTHFAQSTYYYNSTYGSNADLDARSAAAALVLSVFMLAFVVAAYIFLAVCLMNIFKKAGVKPWVAWVPVYNNWKLFEIGGQQGFWAVLSIIPIVNIVASVIMYIAQYHIAKKLGKDGTFVLWAIFLPVVWFIWLAFDKSTWNDTASTAPSLHKA